MGGGVSMGLYDILLRVEPVVILTVTAPKTR